MNESEEDLKIKSEMDEIMLKIDTIVENIKTAIPRETADPAEEKQA
jgi:hypothetical protein